MDAATPVAKIPIVIVEASWLSLWTMAIAARAQAAWTNRHDHLTQLTSDWLTMMRCRRASRAFSSAVAISRCAVFWPSVSGVRARVMCMNGPKATSALSPFDSQLRTLVGAAHRSHSCQQETLGPMGAVIDSTSKTGHSSASTDHLLAARRGASGDLAMAVVPNGAAHAQHEIRYCRGLQSTGVRSR